MSGCYRPIMIDAPHSAAKTGTGAVPAGGPGLPRFLPPLAIGEALLEEGLGILADAFAAL
jgi:hypothetical protein